jgi:hypothetical protein
MTYVCRRPVVTRPVITDGITADPNQ